MKTLMPCISAEWLKLRRSHLWVVLLVLPVLSSLIGCANYYLNQGVLQQEWYSLWSQVGLFQVQFFFPTLIAICCAYLCRLEHVNKNWNTLMTSPVSAADLYFAKLITAGVLMAFVQLIFFLLYYIGGIILGLTSDLPQELPGWLFRGWLASIMLSALQLTVSLRVRSFAAPVGIALLATFMGLAMYVINSGLFFPHSLLTTGMGVLSQESLPPQQQLIGGAMVLLYTALFSAAAIHRLRTSDVVA